MGPFHKACLRLIIALAVGIVDPHLTDEETEAQRRSSTLRALRERVEEAWHKRVQ